MFGSLISKKDKRTDAEVVVDARLDEMLMNAKSQKEISEAFALVERRDSIRKKSYAISPDTVAIVLGNLLGIGLILGHERLHIVTTKALGFIIKGRV